MLSTPDSSAAAAAAPAAAAASDAAAAAAAAAATATAAAAAAAAAAGCRLSVLVLLLLELQPKLVEITLFVRPAAHRNCWKGHLPSHNLFPKRRSAETDPTYIAAGQMVLFCAVRLLSRVNPNSGLFRGVHVDILIQHI
jgi:hypothetical protein